MKRVEFNTAKEAKLFACGLGIEREFLFNSQDSEIESPVVIYVNENSSGTTAFVIIYTLTFEIGLWVHPDLRGRGIGGRVFRDVVEAIENKKDRIFAFINSNDGNAQAMCKILLRNGFSPILPRDSLQAGLWARSFY